MQLANACIGQAPSLKPTHRYNQGMSPAPPSDNPISARNESATSKRLTRTALIVVVLLGASSFLILSLRELRESANREKCAQNLRSLGMAMMLYANGHNGEYPDSFKSLLIEEQITSAILNCPSTNDEPAEGRDSAEVASNLDQSNHLSYVYVGGGATTATVKPTQLIAYEPPENHQQNGMNMLFDDGHVEWNSLADAQSRISSAATATQP